MALHLQLSREAIHQEILNGDMSNIDRIEEIDDFYADEIEAIIRTGVEKLSEIVEQSKTGCYMSRSVDFGGLTAMFLFRGGRENHWERVIDFLKVPLIESREKASIANVLLQNITKIPEDVASKMASCGRRL